jgi:hypothetical protein
MKTFKTSGKNSVTYTLNEKYSHKDWTDVDLTDVDPEEFNDTCIVNSCFYHTPKGNSNRPKYPVFPPNVSNVRFISCNLDNVLITGGMDISDDGFNRNSNQQIELEE